MGLKESERSIKSIENLPAHNWADKGAGKLLLSLAGFLPLPLSLCDSCSPGYPSCWISVTPLPALLRGCAVFELLGSASVLLINSEISLGPQQVISEV